MSSRRIVALGLGAGLLIAAAALALALGACGGAGSGTGAGAGGSTVPRAEPTIAADARRSAPRAPASPKLVRLPSRGNAVLYVKDGQRVAIRTQPRGGRLVRRVGPRTPFGSRTVFSVVRAQGAWAAVVTPYLPNGELGWVRLSPRSLGAYESDWSVAVDLSSRSAQLIRRGAVVRTFAVTVGAPGTDTPTGRFAITDTFRGGGLNPAYGCCAAALSAHQPALPSGWLGGSRIAIHGTVDALGMALSHGCVRASNADVGAIVSRVPIGSPVVIHS